MTYPVFYVPAGDVLPVLFSSYSGSTGASVTLTGLAVTDVEIYKDGSVTQRASDAGYTLLDTDGIDFDAITGIHGFSIDTGDNTDAGFYTVGAWFTVVVSAVTIDSQTVNFIACQFRLMPAESIAGKPKVDVDAWLGTAAATPTVAGVPEVDVTHWKGAAAPLMASVSGTADAGSTASTMVDAARTEAATDYWRGQALIMTSGANNGLARLITAFNAATDTITVSPAFPSAIGTGDTYDIFPATDAILAQLTHTGATVPTVTTLTGHTAQTGDCFARLGAPAGASVSADIAGVQSDTNDIQTRLPASLVSGRIDASVGAMSAAAIQAIWDALTSALTTVGSIGKLIVDNLNAAISSRSSHTAADVWAVATRRVSDATNITSTGGTTVPQTGDSFARLGAPAGASVSADVAAVQADTNDIQTRLPAALVGGRMDANASAVNNVATAAARLARSTQGIVTGTVGSASTTTSIVTSALDPAAAVADQFKGRIVTFDQGTTTTNLRGQSTDITANTAAGVLTVTALTTAPVSGDTFTIT